MSNDDDLLSILQAHGQNFLSSFSLPAGPPAKKRKRSPSAEPSDAPVTDEESEWGGIQTEEDEDDSDSDNRFSEEADFEENDDAFTSENANISAGPSVIVFADSSSTSKKDPLNKSQMKSFMSSKISKLKDEQGVQLKNSSEPTAEDLLERSNVQNDALLHKLVHTKILSGSLNSDLDLTPAQRRKALSGRVLELAGSAELGRGERSVRTAEHNKAAKRVREGLARKDKQRKTAQLEEAKNLGNYHPKLKKLFDDESEAKPKKRVRGLQMGVGSFKSGTLRLSREEINSVQGQRGGASRGRGGGGRGGSRGRSRGKARN